MALSRMIASLRDMMPDRGYRYSALNSRKSSDQRRGLPQESWPQRKRNYVKLSLGGLAAVVVLITMVSFGRFVSGDGCEMRGNCTADTSHIWGQYSPMFSVPSDISTAMPENCEVTFAQMLSRHGARYPTSPKTAVYKETVDRIQKTVSQYGTGYEWIKDFVFELGQDNLTLFGEKEMVESGKGFYDRYQKLAEQSDPFIRAAGSDRVVASAKNFTQGMFLERHESGEEQIGSILVIPEDDGFNNTMNHGSCPAFEQGEASELGSEMKGRWLRIWAPAVLRRLNMKLKGASLSLEEVIYLMDLCPFHTVANDRGEHSRFCKLFSEDEWRSYDYYESVEKWYGYGSGNPLGATQGVGYVNELIARLLGQPVEDETTTNSTLDASPETFPLNHTLYADFSHDNLMISVYAALGLYNETRPLSVRHKVPPTKTHGYSAAWTVPFAGRMYVEKMQCGGQAEELVRVLVNDRVVPLHNCGADELGRCKLGDFVESLSFARTGGRWPSCFKKTSAHPRAEVSL